MPKKGTILVTSVFLKSNELFPPKLLLHTLSESKVVCPTVNSSTLELALKSEIISGYEMAGEKISWYKFKKENKIVLQQDPHSFIRINTGGKKELKETH